MKNLKNKEWVFSAIHFQIANICHRLSENIDREKLVDFALARGYIQRIPGRNFKFRFKRNHFVKALKKLSLTRFLYEEEKQEPVYPEFISLFLRDKIVQDKVPLAEIQGETVVLSSELDMDSFISYLHDDINVNAITMDPEQPKTVYLDFIAIPEANQLPEEVQNDARYILVVRSVASGSVIFWLGFSNGTLPCIDEISSKLGICNIRLEDKVHQPRRGFLSYSETMQEMRTFGRNDFSNAALGKIFEGFGVSDNPVSAVYQVDTDWLPPDRFNAKFQPQFFWAVSGGDLENTVLLLSNRPFLEEQNFERLIGQQFFPIVFPEIQDSIFEMESDPK